jgi:hypothetical protein
MGRLGDSDATLGSALTDVQNTRIVDGANSALAAMLSSASVPPAVAPPATAAATPRPAAPAPATPKPSRATTHAATATPDAATATPTDAVSDQTVPCYEPGTPQYVVRELWLRLNHQPGQSAIVDALGGAGLAHSEQQARKIRAQVREENPGLPGPRAA